MKKFYRIFLASVLALSLLTGSIGIPVFAEEAETAEQEEVLSGAAPESNETAGQEEAFSGAAPESNETAGQEEESLSGEAPERDYYPINHTNPLNYVADTGNISGQLANWVYIENDGKEKGPEQTAVTLGAANGHRNNVVLTNIYIHVNYAEEPEKQSEPTALHVFAENEGTANITLEGMAIAETAGSNAPGDPTAIKAESSSGGQTTVTAEGQVIAGEDTDSDYIDHTLVNASSTGEGSSTTVTLLNTADGDVKISAADGGTSVINIDNEGQGLGNRATLSSSSDGSLAQLNLKEGNVSEICFGGEGGTREANINGDVETQVYAHFTGGEANANITGNLGDPTYADGGINATVREGGTANIDVDGTVYGQINLNDTCRPRMSKAKSALVPSMTANTTSRSKKTLQPRKTP